MQVRWRTSLPFPRRGHSSFLWSICFSHWKALTGDRGNTSCRHFMLTTSWTAWQARGSAVSSIQQAICAAGEFTWSPTRKAKWEQPPDWLVIMTRSKEVNGSCFCLCFRPGVLQAQHHSLQRYNLLTRTTCYQEASSQERSTTVKTGCPRVGIPRSAFGPLPSFLRGFICNWHRDLDSYRNKEGETVA